jgi:hypothetical protein
LIITDKLVAAGPNLQVTVITNAIQWGKGITNNITLNN